jgi:gamma-glutamyltranspeptidase/glutathione hydrolase
MKNTKQLLLVLLLIVVPAVVAAAQQQVTARKYVVASGHPAATAAGLEVLRQGGNVIDAAGATSLALGVAEPYGSGLGGKLVMLYREASSGNVYCVEALCPSAAAMDPEQFSQLSSHDRQYGYSAVGVPGLPAGIYAAHQRWGSRPWAELVEPAAQIAEQGVEISPTMRSMFAAKTGTMKKDPEVARLYLVDNGAPPVGTVLRNPELARSLRLFAQGGAKAVYEGEIAERIVAAAQANGSPLSLDDFRDYRPQFTEPLAVCYRNHCVYSSPPPLTGGATVLAALKALEGQRQLDGKHPRDADYIDAVGRVLLCVYPEVSDVVADVPSARRDTQALLSATQARQFRKQAATIDPLHPYDALTSASAWQANLDDLAYASTSHLVIADAAGNMVSLTQSLSYHFGASVIAPGTGILLNNSMSNFGTNRPSSVNYAAPSKRARSTIAPILVTKNGRPYLVLGIPGGQRIPTTTIQLLADVIDRRDSLGEAFDLPRFHVRRPVTSKEAYNIVDIEDDAPAALDEQLVELGWTPVRQKRDGHYFGGGNAIQYDRDGRLLGVADSRRTNHAAGD